MVKIDAGSPGCQSKYWTEEHRDGLREKSNKNTMKDGQEDSDQTQTYQCAESFREEETNSLEATEIIRRNVMENSQGANDVSDLLNNKNGSLLEDGTVASGAVGDLRKGLTTRNVHGDQRGFVRH